MQCYIPEIAGPAVLQMRMYALGVGVEKRLSRQLAEWIGGEVGM
jgi:hypothetical protein